MIKQLSPEHLSAVLLIIKSVIAMMTAEHIEQWDELYPDSEIIKLDIDSRQAYGFFQQEELKAYLVLNEDYSPEYDALEWKDEGEKYLIIHRLSVDAGCQGQGIAGALMNFAEEYARDSGYSSIRLDAFLQNKAALKLYEKRGYENVGTAVFRKGVFNCYEKIL